MIAFATLQQVGGTNTPPKVEFYDSITAVIKEEGLLNHAGTLEFGNRGPVAEMILIRQDDESEEYFVDRVRSVSNWMCAPY